LGVLLKAEIGGISEVQRVKNYGENQKKRKVKVLKSDYESESTSQNSKLTLQVKASDTI